MTKKVAIGMLSHETNVFSPIQTPLQAWKDRSLTRGQEILDLYTGTKSSPGAFLEVGQRNGWEMIPTLCTSAVPSAPTDAATYQMLKDDLINPMLAAKPDAVLLALHGAMKAEGVDDPEGDIVQSIKEKVGNIPILVVLDLHGNITANMCAHCDGVFGFDTNPHIDSYERGLEAARCLQRIFAGEINPVNAYSHPPMMPPTINMRTAEGPMVELKELAREWEAKPGIINVSVFPGFPYGDVPHAGLSIVTTADGDLELAQRCSDTIAQRAWEIRERFLKAIPRPKEALDQATALLDEQDQRPIILADVADNPGGGGSGDTTELLQEMLKRNLPGGAAAAIWDPETVQQAIEVGVGNTATFRIGGKAEPAYGEPVQVEGTVRVLSDGRFAARGPMGRGMEWNMGRSALIEVGNTKLVVCSIRIACNDADLFRSVGVDPAAARLLLIKSRGHFRASFEPLAKAVIEVDAKGAANPNLDRYHYKFVKRPLWPLDR
ncbi:MAG: M81 family metallopeptidase [Bacillota bacterium]